MEDFNYAGRVYVRPIGRGLVMIDRRPGDGAEDQIECLLDEGYWRFELRAVRLTGDEAKAAEKAMQ